MKFYILPIIFLLIIFWLRIFLLIISNNKKYVRMQSLINHLLRPYRSTYTPMDLGKKRTDEFIRLDGSVLNDREQQLQYSYYQLQKETDVCVIYCHCNSGSRMEGVQYLQQFIEKGWNVCLFDFSGSGQSEGGFISLGYRESKDLDCMVRKMRSYGNRKFLLWGRSMGAATIIFYLSQSKLREDIVACILDSPYSSLWSLAKQLGQQKSLLPGFIVEGVLDYMRSKIKEQHCFDIKQLQPIKYMPNIDVPLFFITSPIDGCIRSQDVVKLYSLSASKNKRLEYIDKAHNSARDGTTINLAISFLQKSLLQKSKKKKQMRVFVRNNRDLTGANMADLIVKAEKEKVQMRRMKSQHHLDRSFKENRSNNQHLKTEFYPNPSVILTNKPQAQRRTEKRKTIKFSLAHLQQSKKLSDTKNLSYKY